MALSSSTRHRRGMELAGKDGGGGDGGRWPGRSRERNRAVAGLEYQAKRM